MCWRTRPSRPDLQQRSTDLGNWATTLGIGPQDPWNLPPPALLPGEWSSSAHLTPTKQGLHPRQRSRSDARRVPSGRCQLSSYGIAPQAPWSAPSIGALCTGRSRTPHSKTFGKFHS